MNGRERVRLAMEMKEPDEVPVMCQLSIGHILLNTRVDPVAFNFTNEGFAQALLEIRDLYDFDGILIHKPGREEHILDITRQEATKDGIKLIFSDGGAILCPYDDDPYYIPPKGYSQPSPDDIEPDTFFDNIPESQTHWWLWCSLGNWGTIDDIPDYYYGCIDRVLDETQGRYSIHGEANAPFDTIFHPLSIEDVLMGLITRPQKIHELLDFFTELSIVWAVAQVRRGCDAIKLSSPWAGAGFISRKHYQEFVLPYERRVAEAVRKEDGIIYTHTCGAIGDRLDLIVASGVNGIECLDPPPLGNIDLAEAKAKWGHRIFIKGNVDPVNILLQKSPDEVRADILERLRIGSVGGGFILSSACSIAPAVPPENVEAMVETAREFNLRGDRS